MSDTDPVRKSWTLLAYTVADDRSESGSLDAAVKSELKEICDAADFGELSIAAQVDFKHTRGVFRASLTSEPPKGRGFEDIDPDDHPLWRTIRDDAESSKLRVQMEREDLNAAKANVLQEFLGFGRGECPADRYALVFYGHAYGPMGLFYDRDSKHRDPNTLRLNDLADSIASGAGRASVVVFRDCFMNTLETAAQLADVAEFMVASQSEIPIAGIWPWLNVIATLMPSAGSRDVARALAMQLSRFLDDPRNRGPFADVPLSMLDLGVVGDLFPPLTELVNTLDAARTDHVRSHLCSAAIEAARIGFPDDHRNPGDPALIDVPTMCDNLRRLAPDPVAGPAAALGEIVGTSLVRWHHSQMGRYRGTSLYYKPVTPKDIERSFIQAGSEEDAARDAEAYTQLALNRATGWHRIALNPLVPAGSAV